MFEINVDKMDEFIAKHYLTPGFRGQAARKLLTDLYVPLKEL